MEAEAQQQPVERVSSEGLPVRRKWGLIGFSTALLLGGALVFGFTDAKAPNDSDNKTVTSLPIAFNLPALQGLSPWQGRRHPQVNGRHPPKISMRTATAVKQSSITVVPMDYWDRMQWAKKERLAFQSQRKETYSKRVQWKDGGGRINRFRTEGYEDDMYEDVEETLQAEERMSETSGNAPVLVLKATGPTARHIDDSKSAPAHADLLQQSSKAHPTSAPAHANLLPGLPRSIALPASTVIATWIGGLEVFKFYERKLAKQVLMKMDDDIKKSRIDQVWALVSKPSADLPPAQADKVYALAGAKNQLLSDKTGRLSEIARRQGLRKAGIDPDYGFVSVMELGEAVLMPVLIQGLPVGVKKMQHDFLLQIVSHAAEMGRLVGISASNERFQKVYEGLGFESVPLQDPGLETFMVYTKPIPNVEEAKEHSIFDVGDLQVA